MQISLTLQQMPESTQRYVIYLFCFLQYLSQGQFTFWVLQPSGKRKAKTGQVGSHDDASYLCSGDLWYASQV